MDKLMEMKKKIEFMVEEELAKGKASAKELGEAVDMIKDLAEANYYCKITEAMEKSENQYGVNYDYRGRMGYMPIDYDLPDYEMPMRWDNQLTGARMNRMGYTGQVGGNMGNRNSSNYRSSGNMSGGMNRNSSNSRYGYSHDDYMTKMDMYDHTNPEMKQKRKELIDERIDELSDMLTDTIEKMTPEEKQMWKMKMNKLINM